MNLQDIMVFGRGINPFGTCTGAAFPPKISALRAPITLFPQSWVKWRYRSRDFQNSFTTVISHCGYSLYWSLLQGTCLKTYVVRWSDVRGGDVSGEIKVFSPSYRHAWTNELRAMTTLLPSNRCYWLPYLWYSSRNPFTGDIAALCGDVVCDQTPWDSF